MEPKEVAHCLVVRDSKILMIKQKRDGREFYAIPGGGIEQDETPEQAAIRELWEECNVSGKIIRKLSTFYYPYFGTTGHTFHMDIGDQTPKLGPNLDEAERNDLQEVRWMALDELSERDRCFLWASGLLGVLEFWNELVSWGDDISFPRKRTELLTKL